MKISIYTFVQNGLYLDYHVVEMLKHHVRLADEIVVNEGFSTDGTFEAIRNLDPKIKVYRNALDTSDASTWSMKSKNWARQQCTGDWCILLDCDEFLPEWEFDRLRHMLARTKQDIFPLRFHHFYGNYRVEQLPNQWGLPPELGTRIHRNLDSIAAWGDGANVKHRDRDHQAPLAEQAFDCHHFGEVRFAARLRQKWRAQALRHRERSGWDWVPSVVFNFFPHRWDDPEILPRLRLYDGPLIEAVRNNPDEFVRDGFRTCRILEARDKAEAACCDLPAT